MIHPVLTALGLGGAESGTYLGDGAWSTTSDAGVIEPVNPTDGSVLARVQSASRDDYETIVERAQAAFRIWRTTPAPRRGEAVRLCAEALRTHKDALGSLVALADDIARSREPRLPQSIPDHHHARWCRPILFPGEGPAEDGPDA